MREGYDIDDAGEYILFPDGTESKKFQYVTLFKQGYADFSKAYFSKTVIDSVGQLLQLMMQYRPSDRPSATEILSHAWFDSRMSGRN